MEKGVERPTGVVVLSLIQIAFSTLLFFTALMTLFLPITMVDNGEVGLVQVLYISTTIMILSGLGFMMSYGLYHGRTWSWYGEVLLILTGILNILFTSIFSIGNIVFAALLLIPLAYLASPGVKRFFNLLEEPGEDVTMGGE